MGLPDWVENNTIRRVEHYGNAKISKPTIKKKKLKLKLKQWDNLPIKDRKERQIQKRELKTLARKMRKEKTVAIVFLWEYLKLNKMGVRFKQQFEFSPFCIIDFVCHEKKLAIEIDGLVHENKDGLNRTKILEDIGYCVVRFTNEEVIQHVDKAVAVIRQLVKSLPSGSKKANFFVWTKGVRSLEKANEATVNLVKISKKYPTHFPDGSILQNITPRKNHLEYFQKQGWKWNNETNAWKLELK